MTNYERFFLKISALYYISYVYEEMEIFYLAASLLVRLSYRSNVQLGKQGGIESTNRAV